MKILIIGGTGNMGTAITSELLNRGHDLTLFNFENDDYWNGRTKRIVGNRNNREFFETEVIKTGPWDCVIDKICFSPEDAKSNIRAFAGRTKQLIFTSTVDAYTKPAKAYPAPVNSERKPDPAFTYGYNKAQCEFMFEEAAAKGAFNLTIIRPVATYNDSWLPLTFIAPYHGYEMRRIRDEKPLIVTGDGTSLWPSVHRDDVAQAFVNAAGNPKAFNKSYVTAPDEVHTWITYYNTVARVMGARPVTFVNIPPAQFLGFIDEGILPATTFDIVENLLLS